jgi:hypothetical protein
MPRIDKHAPGGAACPELTSMPRGEQHAQGKQHAQKGTACQGRAACQGGAAYLGGSSMPRVSGIKGLHIAAFNEIEDKLVSVF